MDHIPEAAGDAYGTRRVKNVSLAVLVASVLVLIISGGFFVRTSTAGGEVSHAIQNLSRQCFWLAAWGTVTGIGLIRMRRWARMSALVLSAVLTLFGIILLVIALSMPNRGMFDWHFYVNRAAVVLVALIPGVIGVPGLVFFARKKVGAEFGRAQLDSTGPFNNLVPLSAYLTDETGYWKRLPFFSGLFYGLCMAVFASVFPLDDSNLLYSRVTRVLISFFFGGIFFGLFFPLLARWLVRSLQEALYAGKSWIDVPPPANSHINYRIVCSLLDGRIAVGGVAYLGSDGMIFVPHKRNRIRNSRILEMKPLSGLKFGTATPPVGNRIQRILIPHQQPLLEVVWPQGRARFLVPCAPTLVPRLSELAQTLVTPE